MCINSITRKAKEYYFASIIYSYLTITMFCLPTRRFLARVRFSLSVEVFSRHFRETEMAWLLRNVVVTKLIHRPVFKCLTVMWRRESPWVNLLWMVLRVKQRKNQLKRRHISMERYVHMSQWYGIVFFSVLPTTSPSPCSLAVALLNSMGDSPAIE